MGLGALGFAGDVRMVVAAPPPKPETVFMAEVPGGGFEPSTSADTHVRATCAGAVDF